MARGNRKIKKLPILCIPSAEEIYLHEKTNPTSRFRTQLHPERRATSVMCPAALSAVGFILQLVIIIGHISIPLAIADLCFYSGLIGIGFLKITDAVYNISSHLKVRSMLDEIERFRYELGIPIMLEQIICDIENRAEPIIATRDTLCDYRARLGMIAKTIEKCEPCRGTSEAQRFMIERRVDDVNAAISAIDQALDPISPDLNAVQNALDAIRSDERLKSIRSKIGGLSQHAEKSLLQTADSAYKKLCRDMNAAERLPLSNYKGLADEVFLAAVLA